MVVQKADVVIIGEGVIGASIFYQIAKEKVEVVLLEKSSIASGTSSACEGLIFLQTKKPGIHLKMAMQSADLFKTLEDELDYKIEYVADGAMVVIPEQIQMKHESNNLLYRKLWQALLFALLMPGLTLFYLPMDL
jgi:sarcosine oxidase subunit beta